MTRILLIGLLGLVSVPAWAQVPAAARNAATRNGAARNGAALDCRACHTSATPTKNAPALAACPRLKIKGYHAIDEAPATITLGKDGATYGAVTFAHRAHAHMAETGKGCNGCHHYDQAGPIRKCKSCHAVSRLRQDVGKPDLKGAMHRQCLECHRDWNPTGACSTCHATKGTAGLPAVPTAAKKPTVTTPERIVYQTGAKEGKTVTFFHAEHVKRFALACADCHQQQACVACHDRKRAAVATPVLTLQTRQGLTEEQAHIRCDGCHAKTPCATCHAGMTPRSTGFDHARRTGFALNRFHAPLTCKQCHKNAGAFSRISADCESCHKGWQARFDHAKTGLVLDEQHKDADCVSCHEDKTFRAAPTCTSCHTDKAWPAQKPGKVSGRGTAGR